MAGQTPGSIFQGGRSEGGIEEGSGGHPDQASGQAEEKFINKRHLNTIAHFNQHASTKLKSIFNTAVLLFPQKSLFSQTQFYVESFFNEIVIIRANIYFCVNKCL